MTTPAVQMESTTAASAAAIDMASSTNAATVEPMQVDTTAAVSGDVTAAAREYAVPHDHGSTHDDDDGGDDDDDDENDEATNEEIANSFDETSPLGRAEGEWVVYGKLKKKVLREGTGRTPKKGIEVKVHYTGRLIDGTVFDSSVNRAQLLSFRLGEGQVIKGWDEGLASMRLGEKALLTIAPDYAYGAAGSPPKIPAHATLEFEVELISFDHREAVTSDRGVMKEILVKGKGWQRASNGSTVTAHVKISYFPQTDSADNAAATVAATDLDQPLDEQMVRVFEVRDVEYEVGSSVHTLDGIERALKSMVEGEHAQFILRPDYAYGEQGFSPAVPTPATAVASSPFTPTLQVPPNTPLLCDIEVVKMVRGKDSWQMSEEDKITAATREREIGNAFFKAGRLSHALERYEHALTLVQPPAAATKSRRRGPAVAGNDDGDSDGDGDANSSNDKQAKDEETDGAAPMYVEESAEALRKKQALHVRLALLNNMSLVHFKLNDMDKTIERCTQAIKADRRNAKALLRRAQAYAHKQELEAARKDVQRAIALEQADLMANKAEGERYSPLLREMEKELARITRLLRAAELKQRKTFGGWLNKVSLVGDMSVAKAKAKAVAGDGGADGDVALEGQSSSSASSASSASSSAIGGSDDNDVEGRNPGSLVNRLKDVPHSTSTPMDVEASANSAATSPSPANPSVRDDTTFLAAQAITPSA